MTAVPITSADVSDLRGKIVNVFCDDATLQLTLSHQLVTHILDKDKAYLDFSKTTFALKELQLTVNAYLKQCNPANHNKYHQILNIVRSELEESLATKIINLEEEEQALLFGLKTFLMCPKVIFLWHLPPILYSFLMEYKIISQSIIMIMDWNFWSAEFADEGFWRKELEEIFTKQKKISKYAFDYT